MNIKFLVKDKEQLELLTERPYPASKFLPDWYKKLELKYDPTLLSLDTFKSNPLGRTIRMCMPVFDIIKSPCFMVVTIALSL